MGGKQNWATIRDGATFEALVRTIVFFEDPKAFLFGRLGKDGGQDVKSGDGYLVYQAKYHQDESASKAISDAKAEAKKICEYRKLGNTRHEQWKGVSGWKLVTNAVFNPSDDQKWQEEVVPLFEQMGIESSYWVQSNLDALITKHPEIERTFFDGEIRVFLSLPEAKEKLIKDNHLFNSDSLPDCVGRDKEIKQAKKFLQSDKLFLLVDGPGGIGKSRLLFEIADDISAEGAWQVLWANIESMKRTPTWFTAIVRGKPTLLIVDEPDDDHLLKVIEEQFKPSKSKWKVVVSVRSYNDTVVKFIRNRAERLEVEALEQKAAEEMCIVLLRKSKISQRAEEWYSKAAQQLALRFSKHPIWMSLAIHLLESDNNLDQLPTRAEDIASKYLEEILRAQYRLPREKIETLLRWISLLATVNREDESLVNLLSIKSDISDPSLTLNAIYELCTKKACIARGKNDRLVEIKPDVIRDHILSSWLTIPTGLQSNPIMPSRAAEIIVDSLVESLASGEPQEYEKTILISLVRTEKLLSFSGKKVAIFERYFSKIQVILESLSASKRLILLESVTNIAEHYPVDIKKITDYLKTNHVAPEVVQTIWGEENKTQEDVVMGLSWPLFRAAHGAEESEVQQLIIKDLLCIAEEEWKIKSNGKPWPTDGKRAGNVLLRILEGGPQYADGYIENAYTIIASWLSGLIKNPPSKAQAEVYQSFVTHALYIERQQTWSEGYAIKFNSVILNHEHPIWTKRKEIIQQIRTVIDSDATDIKTLEFLWRVLSETHRHTNYTLGNIARNSTDSGKKEEKTVLLEKEIMEDLLWAQEVITKKERKQVLQAEEMKAARELWDWHNKYDEDPAKKTIAAALDSIFMKNDAVSEFEPLVDYHEYERLKERSIQKALKLAKSKKEIHEYVERATRYFNNKIPNEIYNVGNEIGHSHYESGEVISYIKEQLRLLPSLPQINFAIAIASSAVLEMRRKKTDPITYIRELISSCRDDETKVTLLQLLYGYGYIDRENIPYRTEAELLWFHSDKFVSYGKEAEYIKAISWTMYYDLSKYMALIKDLFSKLNWEDEKYKNAFYNMVESLYRNKQLIQGNDEAKTIVREMILKYMLALPNIEETGQALWYFEELLKTIGKADIKWLAYALERRGVMAKEYGYPRVKALPIGRYKLTNFISPIRAEDLAEEKTQGAIDKILQYVLDMDAIGYFLPEQIAAADPVGIIFPQKIAEMVLQHKNDDDIISRLGRCAGFYKVGTPAWRIISKPTIEIASKKQNRVDKISLFASLSGNEVRSWTSAPGEVAQIFYDSVKKAKAFLEEEKDPTFLPFWKWYLEAAEAELKAQEEEIKEEKGE